MLAGPLRLFCSSAVEVPFKIAVFWSARFWRFFDAYQKRIADLLRIATGGSGQLPTGRLYPDLLNRLAGEASQLAERFLRMYFRAFDYMPPVGVTFGDFLRALVTSDFELNPQDSGEVRFSIIEAFRERGIYPAGVVSLAEESLLWPSQINGQPPPLYFAPLQTARQFLNYSATALDQGRIASRRVARIRVKAQRRHTRAPSSRPRKPPMAMLEASGRCATSFSAR